MSLAVPLTPTASPLTAKDFQDLAQAQTRAKKIRRAAGVAAMNGWLTGFFALTSAPFAPFSLASFLVTIGLGVIAYNEFRGRRRLLQFDPESAALLGWNQVAFLGLIATYCLWMLYTGLTGEGVFAAELKKNPELTGALGSVEQYDDLYRGIVLAVYGTIIMLSGIFQGGNAWYYFSRRKFLAGYVRETPAWICDVQRATAAR